MKYKLQLLSLKKKKPKKPQCCAPTPIHFKSWTTVVNKKCYTVTAGSFSLSLISLVVSVDFKHNVYSWEVWQHTHTHTSHLWIILCSLQITSPWKQKTFQIVIFLSLLHLLSSPLHSFFSFSRSPSHFHYVSSFMFYVRVHVCSVQGIHYVISEVSHTFWWLCKSQCTYLCCWHTTL